MEEGYHIQLTSLFATKFSMGMVTISGVEINLSIDLISSATSIPCYGEKWFKGMDLDIQN